MYKNIPDHLQNKFQIKVNETKPSNYKYPTTLDEYWSIVDKYWPQLLNLFSRFLPPVVLDLQENTHTIAETYRKNRNPEIIYLFNKTWSNAPDDGSIHLLDGWYVLCDLCSESYLLEPDVEE